jgi:hypothetical protein
MVNLPCVFLHKFCSQENEVLQQRKEKKLHTQSKACLTKASSNSRLSHLYSSIGQTCTVNMTDEIHSEGYGTTFPCKSA